MRRIGDHVDEELMFVQPNPIKARYELRSGESVIGELAFRNVFSSTARAESQDGSWSFQRTGLFRKRTSIRVSGHDAEIAWLVELPWNHGGILHLPGKSTIRMTPNFWLTTFEIATNEGSPLARFHRVRSFLRQSASVRILPEAGAMTEIPWLVFLGWFVIALATRDRRAHVG